MPASERTDPAAPDGALVHSAKVARALALEHCPQAIGGDCTWYHGVWQYLRALGFVKRAGGHADFLGDTLRQLALVDRARRVLISGSADDAMSLIALEAFRDARVSPELTVMDRCEAPLALSRWSAAQAGASVASQRADIIEFSPVALYDVIATSGFLSYFEPVARARLFARWASLLRPGGKLVFTNRLRPAAVVGVPAGFTSDEARSLSAAVRARAERHRSVLALDPAELEKWTLDYATRIKTFPVKSVDEILALLKEAGFAPDHVDTAVFPGTPGGVAVAGPTAADRSAFVRVIATRGADSHS